MRWRHKLIEAFGNFWVWHLTDLPGRSDDVRTGVDRK
jgi:hypothetical protein